MTKEISDSVLAQAISAYHNMRFDDISLQLTPNVVKFLREIYNPSTFSVKNLDDSCLTKVSSLRGYLKDLKILHRNRAHLSNIKLTSLNEKEIYMANVGQLSLLSGYIMEYDVLENITYVFPDMHGQFRFPNISIPTLQTDTKFSDHDHGYVSSYDGVLYLSQTGWPIRVYSEYIHGWYCRVKGFQLPMCDMHIKFEGSGVVGTNMLKRRHGKMN
jgi:hypothetical protein